MNLDMFNRFRRCWENMETIGHEYAEAKGQSWQSQELKHSILANIVKKYPNIAVSKAEHEARASEEYQDYVKETSKLITKELRLKASYARWEAEFEATRSLSSLEKAQINSEGH